MHQLAVVQLHGPAVMNARGMEGWRRYDVAVRQHIDRARSAAMSRAAGKTCGRSVVVVVTPGRYRDRARRQPEAMSFSLGCLGIEIDDQQAFEHQSDVGVGHLAPPPMDHLLVRSAVLKTVWRQ